MRWTCPHITCFSWLFKFFLFFFIFPCSRGFPGPPLKHRWHDSGRKKKEGRKEGRRKERKKEKKKRRREEKRKEKRDKEEGERIKDKGEKGKEKREKGKDEGERRTEKVLMETHSCHLAHVTQDLTTTAHYSTAAQSWRSDDSSPWMSHHPSGSRQGHPQYTGGRTMGRLWVARLTRTQHATAVASTTRYMNTVAERNTTTTTAPRPPSTHHIRLVQTQLTGDQPRNWRATTQEPITDRAGTCVGTRRQAWRREEHRIRIDADGVSSVNTKSLNTAFGVHVGKDDPDVGTEDQAARLTQTRS